MIEVTFLDKFVHFGGCFLLTFIGYMIKSDKGWFKWDFIAFLAFGIEAGQWEIMIKNNYFDINFLIDSILDMIADGLGIYLAIKLIFRMCR